MYRVSDTCHEISISVGNPFFMSMYCLTLSCRAYIRTLTDAVEGKEASVSVLASEATAYPGRKPPRYLRRNPLPFFFHKVYSFVFGLQSVYQNGCGEQAGLRSYLGSSSGLSSVENRLVVCVETPRPFFETCILSFSGCAERTQLRTWRARRPPSSPRGQRRLHACSRWVGGIGYRMESSDIS